MARAGLIVVFLRVMSLLPLSLARLFGIGIGFCLFLFSTRQLKTTRTNLSLCFPEATPSDRGKMAGKSLLHTGMTMAECGAVWLWPVERIIGRILEVEGMDLFEAAVSHRQGVIIIAPHLGHWELLGLYLGRLGPSCQLYQAPKSPKLDKEIFNARSRGGARMVETNNRGVAELLSALKRGETAGILPDQVPPPGAGEFAPFFGNPAYTMTLIPRLIRKTGARALMGCALREKNGFRIIFREPDERIYAEAVQTALLGLNKTVENAVNEAPEQYQWEYKRFRYQPDGSSEPY